MVEYRGAISWVHVILNPSVPLFPLLRAPALAGCNILRIQCKFVKKGWAARPLGKIPYLEFREPEMSLGTSRVTAVDDLGSYPLIIYTVQHPCSRLENLSYWYATEVWRIPLVCN